MENHFIYIQNISKLLQKETDPAKRRIYKRIINETIDKIEQLKSA